MYEFTSAQKHERTEAQPGYTSKLQFENAVEAAKWDWEMNMLASKSFEVKSHEGVDQVYLCD